MNRKIENLDLHDIIFIFKKYIVLIVISTVAFGILGLVVSKFFIAPQYQAEAKLIVNTTSTLKDASQVYSAVQLSQKEVDTYAIIMENNTILDNVIKNLNLNITKEELTKKIDVQGIGTTEVLDLKVRDENPETAKAIAAEIIKLAPSEIIRIVKAGSVEVISQPEAESSPVSPNTRLNTMAVAAIGLVLSVLAAFLIEMLNNTFTNDDDVQKYLDFAVIGVIPNINSKRGSK